MLEKISILKEKLEKKEKETGTKIYRDFESFKARLLDIPWLHTMKPLIDDFPEVEQIIEDKIRREFPLILYELQLKIIDLVFEKQKFKGVKVVQRRSSLGKTNFLLQINLEETDMPEDQIINYYHNGMIDFLEFGYTHKIENLLNKLGEKLVFVAGNIASYSTNPIGCKIFSSFPEMDNHTYRPARKRIFISEIEPIKEQIKGIACIETASDMDINWWLDDDFCPANLSREQKHQLEYARKNIRAKWIIEAQKTPKIPIFFPRRQFKLVAEGHYTQIWAHHNWVMFLPFIGESEDLEQWDIMNEDGSEDNNNTPSPGSPVSIDSTHRDF